MTLGFHVRREGRAVEAELALRPQPRFLRAAQCHVGRSHTPSVPQVPHTLSRVDGTSCPIQLSQSID